jgi:dipeptidyl aminopeptidase/acylaminoacyl peptidase
MKLIYKRPLITIYLWAVCQVIASPLLAAPIPAEVFFKDPDIAEAVLSPSGRKLAVTSAKGLSRVGLVVIDLAPGGKTMRAAQFSDGDVSQVRWVNEERLLFSVVDYSEGSGRPDGAPGLYAVNPDGNQMRQLVRRQNRQFFSNGDSSQDRTLDWNHTLLRVPVLQPGETNEEVLVSQFSLDEQRIQTPLWLNTLNGRSRSADFDPPRAAVGWLTDSRGDARVVFTRKDGKQSAYWRAPGQREWQLLYESGLIEKPFTVNSVDDLGTLYVTRQQGSEGYGVLTRYDFERRAPELTPLVTTPGFDFSGSVLTEAGTGRATGVRLLVDGETTVWFDDRLKALQAEADKLLPGRTNRISCRRCGKPDMVALVRSFSDQDPGQLLLYQARPAEGERRWQRVTKAREGIDPATMAAMQLHRIKARDGLDLPIWITNPIGEKMARPAVVLVHGGPWVRGSSYSWHAMSQFLASRGYVVIEPEMRGSTGYGQAHFKAGFKQFGQAMQDDVADALLWARSQGLASDKACIAGSSYGGYSTLMGLIKDPDLYRCGVAWMALTDLDLYLTGSWWINDDISSIGRRFTLPEMVGDAEKDAAMISANSPVRQADRIKAPLLLAFGDADRRIPLAHGERLRKAMKASGNDPEWVTYAGEGHGFAVVKNRVDFAQRMEAFLAKHLAQ